MARPYTHRLLRGLALVALAAALLASFPGRPVGAQGSEIQTLDNTQVQFARGVFQRTSISAAKTDVASIPVDVEGAVQLAPTGALKPWEKVAVELPTRNVAEDDGTRADAAVVALGNRLYVIAGTSTASPGGVNTVFWANINQVLGEITAHGVASSDPRFIDENWLNAPLPDAALVPNCSVQISERTRAAAAALSTSGNAGFIYVVGGLTPPGECETDALTSVGVQIGAVAADGQITWTTSSNRLPSAPIDRNGVQIDLGPRGVEEASATVVRTASGKAFLYVIGGLSTYYNSNNFQIESNLEKSVFRAEINTSTGALGDWVRDDDVPVVDLNPGDVLGIHDHVAVHVTTAATTDSGTTIKDGILVAGGFTSDANSDPDGDPNPFVYRAMIDPASGDLTWDATPSPGDNQVTIGQSGQNGMSGIAYNNKIYLIGGEIGANPVNERRRDTVITATFNDNLEVQNIPGSSDYFIGRTTPVLPNGPRVDSGAALMDALPPPDNPTGDLGSAWVMAVGGEDGNGQISRFIFRGRIGGDEADGSIRASDGWFYSAAFNVTFQQQGQQARNARVLSIRWAAEVKRDTNTNADMIVQFRKTLRPDPNCPNDSVFDADDQWFQLDGDTGSNFFTRDSNATNPFNTVTLKDAFGTEDFVATCFQYRVRFIQNGLDANGVPVAAAAPSATPKLLSMNIEKIVAGNADIRIAENGFAYTAPNGRMASFTTAIRNLSLEGVDNTQDAGLNDNDGSFFVHLCVAFAPAGQPAPTLTVPTLPLPDGPNPECFKAYYEVYKWQMRKGATLNMTTSGDQSWKRQTSPTSEEAISDIRTLFSEPGTYRVAMIIDARNFVNEGSSGETNNRGEDINNGEPQVLTFEIAGPPINIINLPLLRR